MNIPSETGTKTSTDDVQDLQLLKQALMVEMKLRLSKFYERVAAIEEKLSKS